MLYHQIALRASHAGVGCGSQRCDHSRIRRISSDSDSGIAGGPKKLFRRVVPVIQSVIGFAKAAEAASSFWFDTYRDLYPTEFGQPDFAIERSVR
jgi:hypothetical protein